MGVPSPLIQTTASPLLQGEKANFELPVASIDLNTSDTGSKQRRNWNDIKESPRGACSSGDEQSGQSTDEPALSRSASVGSRSISSSDAKKTAGESMPGSPDSEQSYPASDIMQAQFGVSQMTASSLVPLSAVPEGASGVVTLLLCQIWNDPNTGMSIVPCCGTTFSSDCKHGNFWCYVEPQQDGSVMIMPYNDASACGITEDACGVALSDPSSPRSRETGAPARPDSSAYTPMWVYGQERPFNVAPTTLVLSNLPQELLQEDLIEILDKESFSGFYDFLYLPMDGEFNNNLGYALVNLTQHEYGLSLAALMQGRTSWCGESDQQCQVTWSLPLQGTTELIEYYRHHPSNGDKVPEDMRPTFFTNGWPQPFPPSGEKKQ